MTSKRPPRRSGVGFQERYCRWSRTSHHASCGPHGVRHGAATTVPRTVPTARLVSANASTTSRSDPAASATLARGPPPATRHLMHCRADPSQPSTGHRRTATFAHRLQRIFLPCAMLPQPQPVTASGQTYSRSLHQHGVPLRDFRLRVGRNRAATAVPQVSHPSERPRAGRRLRVGAGRSPQRDEPCALVVAAARPDNRVLEPGHGLHR